MTTAPLPTDLDLNAIHEAFLAAGFTHVTSEGLDTPNWAYLKPGDDFGFIALPNPTLGFTGDGLFCTPDIQRKVAVQALDALIEHTGNPHLHCGPRNARERAYVEALNAALSTPLLAPTSTGVSAAPGNTQNSNRAAQTP